MSELLIYLPHLIPGWLQCWWEKHYSASLTGTQGPTLSRLLAIRCVSFSISHVIYSPEIHNCQELILSHVNVRNLNLYVYSPLIASLLVCVTPCSLEFFSGHMRGPICLLIVLFPQLFYL